MDTSDIPTDPVTDDTHPLHRFVWGLEPGVGRPVPKRASFAEEIARASALNDLALDIGIKPSHERIINDFSC